MLYVSCVLTHSTLPNHIFGLRSLAMLDLLIPFFYCSYHMEYPDTKVPKRIKFCKHKRADYVKDGEEDEDVSDDEDAES